MDLNGLERDLKLVLVDLLLTLMIPRLNLVVHCHLEVVGRFDLPGIHPVPSHLLLYLPMIQCRMSCIFATEIVENSSLMMLVTRRRVWMKKKKMRNQNLSKS